MSGDKPKQAIQVDDFTPELVALGFTNDTERDVIPMEVETEEEANAREHRTAAQTDPVNGLPTAMVERRKAEFGPNELPEKTVPPIIKFLMYFTLPMPIMIWIAAAIELIKAIITGDGWEDFVVLMVLQFLNATVGFVEELNAGNAVAALKAKLTPECRVCRNGEWLTMASRELVPGDLIELLIGHVVPADCILLQGQQPIQVDQSALTGESLPVTIYPDGKAKMGSAVKRGECKAVVCGTGRFTFFGKAAELLNAVVVRGRFQVIVIKITLALLTFSIILVIIIFIFLMTTGRKDVVADQNYKKQSKLLEAVSICVVLLVASIPIAIEVVCTTTMAMGSRRLAQKKVIVARLSAIEELAGMTILCSDKTGTLTQNKLTLNDPVLFADCTGDDLVFHGALASKRGSGQDAVDFCLTTSLTPEQKELMGTYDQLEFVPFNPTDKRTESTVRHPDGHVFRVSKGAPQVIIGMAHNVDDIRPRVETAIQQLADRGFRSLGVAVSHAPPEEEPEWVMLGLLSLYDPPREDAKHTIKLAHENQVEVKMITGDQAAIAKETCRMLGLGTNILTTAVLNGNFQHLGATLNDVILHANGFAEVYPEHKFQIVDALRAMGYVVGMTGDGVNDAPALKRADIGIAVEGATDAAKAAADIVLVEPGLSVIIDAIFHSRKIFQRMRTYCIYRIACTIQLLVFFFFAILTVNPGADNFYGTKYQDATGAFTCEIDHASSFTLPVIALIVITLLNDGTIITIAYDRVRPESIPQSWNLNEVTVIATIMGLVSTLSLLIFLVIFAEAKNNDFLARVMSPHLRFVSTQPNCGPNSGAPQLRYVSWGELETIVYLNLSLAGCFTLLCSRMRTWFFMRRPSLTLGIALLVACLASTLLALWWPFPAESAKSLNMAYINNGYGALFTWIYVFVWFLAQDVAKVLTYLVIDRIQFGDKAEVARRMALSRITSAIDADDRQRRADGKQTDVSGSFRGLPPPTGGSFKGGVKPSSFRSGLVAGSTQSLALDAAAADEVRTLKDRVRKTESELSELKSMVSEIRSMLQSLGASAQVPPPLSSIPPPPPQ